MLEQWLNNGGKKMEIDDKFLKDLQIEYEHCRLEDQKNWDYWTGRIDTCIGLRSILFSENSEE